MGFKRERTVYKLTFSETELDGLEVEASSVSTGTLMKLMKLAVEIGDHTSAGTNGTDITAMDELFEGFSRALRSWNLEDEDGAPVPATLEGLYAQDLEVAMPIVIAWINAVAGVSASLGKDLNSGSPFQEASLPMDPS